MSKRQGTAAIILLAAILLVQWLGPDALTRDFISGEHIAETVGPAAASYLLAIIMWTGAILTAVLVAAVSIIALLVWWNVRQVGKPS